MVAVGRVSLLHVLMHALSPTNILPTQRTILGKIGASMFLQPGVTLFALLDYKSQKAWAKLKLTQVLQVRVQEHHLSSDCSVNYWRHTDISVKLTGENCAGGSEWSTWQPRWAIKLLQVIHVAMFANRQAMLHM